LWIESIYIYIILYYLFSIPIVLLDPVISNLELWMESIYIYYLFSIPIVLLGLQDPVSVKRVYIERLRKPINQL
jgi:hypothetical protein